MKRLALCFGILLLSLQLFAQDQETVFGYSGLKLTGVWGGPSFAFSRISDRSEYFRGGFGGLEFNKSIYVAYAAYWLNDETELPELDNEVDFRYRGLLLGYAFKPNKIVHPKITTLIGGGEVSIDLGSTISDQVFVLQPTAGIGINVFKWWHIDVLGGYRLVTGMEEDNSDLLSNSEVSGAFGEIKLRFGISWGWY